MDAKKLELLKTIISEAIDENSELLGIDEVYDSTAVEMIKEIQQILINKDDDFEIVEDIVCVFEKYNISAGTCHDFG